MIYLIKIGLCSIVVTLVLMVFLTAAHSNENNDDIAIAREEYQKGKKAFDGEEWTTAILHFKKSYDSTPDPQTAYLLSCIFFELNDSSSAIEWATVALEGRPSLEAPYKKGAKDIIVWAEERQKSAPIQPKYFGTTH